MTSEPFARTEPKIAVIGGGTGSFTLLSALKSHTTQLAAIVSMADDGGSTGVLRDELGVLPPGDIRQCLVALSDSPKIRDLFNYRFEEGTFGGHSFGNILLTALEKATGNFGEAVETAAEILRVNGTVIPATLDNVRLKMEWQEASLTLHGERVIDADYFKHDPRQAQLSLEPQAYAHPMALQAIEQADMVVLAPGDLYTSLGALLVIDGIGEALQKTTAPVVYVANLVTKRGQTEGFSVCDHAAEIERLAGAAVVDYVVYNRQTPSSELARRYEDTEGSYVVEFDESALESAHYQAYGGHFLSDALAASHANDMLPVTRSLIRHDTAAVADAIMKLYEYTHSKQRRH
ncbi:MAG: gluconeogenesis factor YvcK family protein [Candidatus Saccharimonadales bacterium]